MIDQKGRGRAERLLRFAKINAVWDNPPSANALIERDEKRLLADPILTDAVLPEEAEFADRLLVDFSPQQIATAFLRLSKAGKLAPEDVQLVSVDGPSRREFRDDKEAGKRRRQESSMQASG